MWHRLRTLLRHNWQYVWFWKIVLLLHFVYLFTHNTTRSYSFLPVQMTGGLVSAQSYDGTNRNTLVIFLRTLSVVIFPVYLKSEVGLALIYLFPSSITDTALPSPSPCSPLPHLLFTFLVPSKSWKSPFAFLPLLGINLLLPCNLRVSN